MYTPFHDYDYEGALAKLRATILAVRPHQVTGIRAEQEARCLQSGICEGHGDAILTLDNGTTLNVECDSVAIGVLMWYFKCGSEHFTEYVDDDFANYLRENIGG